MGLWLNIISRCAFEHERAALYFTLSLIILLSSICLHSQVSGDLLQSCFSGLGDLRQRLTASASGLTCSCVCVCLFVHRMWRQSAGQQRELLLSWIPKWILGLHALHLENISHTGGEGICLCVRSDLRGLLSRDH